MKKTLLASLLFAVTATSFAQLRMPQPSPTQMIVQEFGLGKIELTYSRPLIKNRAYFKEKSELAPFGQVWRTGANSATKIRFTDAVTVGGNQLDSGTYALYTIPGDKDWTIIINKGSKNWGTVYNESDDVMRFKVPVSKLKNNTESFTMQFFDVLAESCALHLMWGNTDVAVPITTNIKDRIRTQLDAAMNGSTKPYFAAANYYYEYEKDYSKALVNVNKAIEENKDAYWMHLLKARILKASGDKAGAKASAEKTIEIATAQKNDDYVRGAKELIRSL